MNVSKQLRKVLTMIDGVMVPFPDKLYPKPHITHEDESVLVEWVFPMFRIGFNLEPDPKESGWHIVAGEHLNNVTFSERLDLDRASRIIMDLLVHNQLIIERAGG